MRSLGNITPWLTTTLTGGGELSREDPGRWGGPALLPAHSLADFLSVEGNVGFSLLYYVIPRTRGLEDVEANKKLTGLTSGNLCFLFLVPGMSDK